MSSDDIPANDLTSLENENEGEESQKEKSDGLSHIDSRSNSSQSSKVDLTRYDPNEIKQQGLDIYGLINGETRILPSLMDGTNSEPSNKPKMIYKNGRPYQWNPYTKKYVDFELKEAWKKQKREGRRLKKEMRRERQYINNMQNFNFQNNYPPHNMFNNVNNIWVPPLNLNQGIGFNFY